MLAFPERAIWSEAIVCIIKHKLRIRKSQCMHDILYTGEDDSDCGQISYSKPVNPRCERIADYVAACTLESKQEKYVGFTKDCVERTFFVRKWQNSGRK